MTIVDDIEAGVEFALQIFVGLVFMAAGLGYVAWEKTHPPTSDWHLAGGLFVAFVGAACLPVGQQIVGGITGVVGAFARLAGVIVAVLTRQPPKDGAP